MTQLYSVPTQGIKVTKKKKKRKEIFAQLEGFLFSFGDVLMLGFIGFMVMWITSVVSCKG